MKSSRGNHLLQPINVPLQQGKVTELARSQYLRKQRLVKHIQSFLFQNEKMLKQFTF